jgi:hypothetical protein
LTIFGLSILAVIILAVIIPSYSTRSQPWTKGAGMSTARTEVVGVVLDGKDLCY